MPKPLITSHSLVQSPGLTPSSPSDQVGQVQRHLTSSPDVDAGTCPPRDHALLVSAGASFSSGVPVAWDVLLDLCRKVAAADGEDIGEEAPDKWWERTRDEEPTYSRVLEPLARTPALRQALLESYFEVTEAERDAGIKQPTAAHKSIARLVVLGAIKVIITLNFDRLIEQALRAAGIEPTVMAQVMGNLGLERRLQHLLGQRGQQPALAGQRDALATRSATSSSAGRVMSGSRNAGSPGSSKDSGSSGSPYVDSMT